MFRLPPQPLLAPAGYRIPIRGRAPDGPMGPLASRLGYPGEGAGRGRGRGRGKGKNRQRNRNRSKGVNNKKGATEVTQPITVEETKPEVTENTTTEDKDDITDDNWQVISEETEETDSPQPPKTDNYVDFHSDMFDASTAEGFSTFSEPVLVISDETETPAAAPIEEVTTDDVTGESAVDEAKKDVVVISVDTLPDAEANDESQEVTILEDEQSTEEQSTPAKETKNPERPSPNITAITAPKPSSPKETNDSRVPLHCKVCNVHCSQQKHMKQHLAGRRHRMNLQAQEYRESKKKERSNSSGRQDSGKTKFVTEAEKKYKAYIKSAVTYPGLSDAMQEFFRHKEPLIGLKYGVEVGKSVDDPNPVYYCSICDEHFNSNVKLRHFTSTQHRKIVLKAEFPHKFSDMSTVTDDIDTCRDIAREVEKEVGRQVHLIRRKVVTTDPISADGELLSKRKRSDRTVKALLDLPPKDYLLEDPSHGYKGPLLEPHDRVVRVVPPSLKREREMGTWSPPPPAKRRNLMDSIEGFTTNEVGGYRSFEGPPEFLAGPSPHPDINLPLRPPLLPSREEPMDSRMRRQGMAGPKPLLSLDLPPIIPGSTMGPSLGPSLSSFSEQLRRMLDTMDSFPVEELIRSEEDASFALHISNSLTKALLAFRMHCTPNVDRGELGSVYSMFSGSRH